jgi:dihydrofolate reductase
MGRKTYEFARSQSTEHSSYPGVTTYVCSRTMPPGNDAGVEVIGGDAADFVRRLKGRPGKDICIMGGGELASALLEAGVIDEIGLNIHPLLLGGGVSFFRSIGRRVELELIKCESWKNGCALMSYRVRN